jgi:hypothetical protein
MSEAVKIWLISLFGTELEETKENIKNYELWRMGCKNPDELPAYDQALEEFREYQEILTDCIKQVEEGTFNV